MGVIYKLQPRISDFIKEIKLEKPELSCRGLSSLIQERFQVKVSKSSVNSVIKGTGLSMPIGRRPRPKRGIVEAEGLGAILLKAADYLLGGSELITKYLQDKLLSEEMDIPSSLEYLKYSQLFDLQSTCKTNYSIGLWPLIGKKIPQKKLNAYLSDIQQLSPLLAELVQIMNSVMQEIRCVKINFSDDSACFIDGQGYTVWANQYIPYNFSTTISDIRSYVTKFLQGDQPFVFYMPPGSDSPGKEFFDFLLNFISPSKRITNLGFYDMRLKQTDILSVGESKKRSLIFGLWPWQYVAYRKIKILSDFKNFYFEPLRKDFFLADAEVQLLQPNTNQSVILRGCALKTSYNDKIRVIVLSNITPEEASIEDLARHYLNKWPNLEETFQDFSCKQELFSYTLASGYHFSWASLDLDSDALQNSMAFFSYYLKILDLYVKWHFLPFGFEKRDFATIKQQFYGLKCRFKKQKDLIYISFLPPENYSFQKELTYLCNRLNEKAIHVFNGKRLWFNSAK